MKTFRNLALNFGARAVRALGHRQYLRLLMTMVGSPRGVLRTRDLREVDRRMGTRPVSVRFRGRRFIIDCPTVDSIIRDGTFTFGLIRELFIRNCYIRERVAPVLDSAQYVLDLGANRGVFSVMAAIRSKLVVAVEVLPLMAEAIRSNMAANGLDNIVIESAFVGEGGADEPYAASTTTVNDIMASHNVPRFDLVKIDIEGSEFGLFADRSWLRRGMVRERN